MEIEVLRHQGMSLRRIACEVGCAVNTVRSHLAAPGLPGHERKVRRVIELAPFGAYLRDRQRAAHPHWIPATGLMREIAARAYTGGPRRLRAFMRAQRPPPSPDPVVTWLVRTSSDPSASGERLK